jgi:hypothetical protein
MTSSARSGLFVLLCACGVFALWTVVDGVLSEVSFEPTDASNFQAALAQPQITGGMIAIGAVVIGFVIWFVARRRARLLAVCIVVCVAAIVSGSVGLAVRRARSHPEYSRARALSRLELPATFLDTGTTLDHASSVTAPAATRSWTTHLTLGDACSDVRDAVIRWADRGSGGRVVMNAARCYLSARWHGHDVDANVIGRSSDTTVSVRLAG